MPRETKTFDMHTTREARQIVGKPEAYGLEWADTDVKGLCIRFRAASATWALRGRLGPRQSIWAIGAIDTVSVSQARDRARKAKDLLKRGIDPKEALAEDQLGGKIERTFDPKKDGWTWEQGRDAYLAEIRQTHAAATCEDYRKSLAPKKSGDLDPLKGKLLKAITDDDIRRCQLAAWNRGKKNQAHHLLRILKACFSWLIQQPDSGIKASAAAGVKFLDMGRLARADTGKKLGKLRTGEEIARMVWGLERADAAPRLAAALCLFTVQRISTVLKAHKGEVEAAPKAGGGMWNIPPAHIKGKREHLLPLPTVAYHLMKSAIAISASPTLVFPQMRLRRAGDAGGSLMSPNVVRRAMAGMMGPHDSRASFTTHGKVVLRFAHDEIQAVLHHAEGASGDVTLEHYDLSAGLHFKWRVLREWERWLLEQIAVGAPGSEPMPAFMRPDAGVRNPMQERHIDKLIS